MKKSILVLIFAVMSIGVQAQTHLKFQGIPIDDTFAQFEAKLKAKGWVYDYITSKAGTVDPKAYKGTFITTKNSLGCPELPFQKSIYYCSPINIYINETHRNYNNIFISIYISICSMQ